MRVATPKPIDPAESSVREMDAIEPELPLAASALVDTHNWATRAQPRGIARVPTHTVGRAHERRAYVRARMSLPLRLRRIAGQREAKPIPLHTQNISSSGVFFLCRHRIEPGTPIEMEVLLVDRPFGRGTVRMLTEAHVVRVQDATKRGWHGLAATFDDISFFRDEPLPPRYRTA